MIQLKRVIAPADDTPFDDICSFETENFVGVYVESLPKIHLPGFMIMPKENYEFMAECIDMPDSLDKLDNVVFDKVYEHIESVSTSRCLEIKINEDC